MAMLTSFMSRLLPKRGRAADVPQHPDRFRPSILVFPHDGGTVQRERNGELPLAHRLRRPRNPLEGAQSRLWPRARCAVSRATQAFQSLRLTFLQRRNAAMRGSRRLLML
jgi:hypothetical protein